MVETIEFEGAIYAIIIRSTFRESGIQFFTPESFSQQLGYMSRPKGYHVQPHFHVEVKRQVHFTQEVLFIRSGSVRVTFFTDNLLEAGQVLLESGDVIMLCNGGHGLEMLEDSEIIEVKQGPYMGDSDKVRFEPAPG